MNKYTGISCVVCGQAFREDDDVVVCPTCGAPHHRACYQEAGHCGLAAQHAPDFAWQGPPPPEPPPAPKSTQPHPAQAASQSSFGGYTNPQPDIDTRGGISLDDKVEEIPMRDVAQFVGPGVFYYLPRFKLMSLTQRSMVPSFSAVFFSFFYYFNRKMYKMGALLLALFVVMVVPLMLITYRMFPDMLVYITAPGTPPPDFTPYTGLIRIFSMFQMLFFGASVVAGLFANKLYFTFVVRNVRRIREEYKGRVEHEYMQALAVRGRTNKMAIVLVFVGLFVAYMAFQVLIATTYSNII